jgi:hypothetical protein
VLSKFSHDSDSEVAHNAILAMGIVGAGMKIFVSLKLEFAVAILLAIFNFCVDGRFI